MKDIFNDAKFDRSLYGGVHDLEEDIGSLVYKLYKVPFVKTNCSCSGHIGKRLPFHGKIADRDGYFVYEKGFLGYVLTENALSMEFQEKVGTLAMSTRFASIMKENGNKYSICLGMSDLVEPITEEKKAVDGPFDPFRFDVQFTKDISRKHEVKQELAIQRYEEFKKFWKDMEGIADLYVTSSLDCQ